MRLLLKLVGALLLAVVLYFGVTFVQVWQAARRDQAQVAQAIVVFGAAQYNGTPSPVLQARLDHAVDLYRRKFAPVVVVTGGRQQGDQFTEATASADYLHRKGVPDSAILREVSSQSSWQSLAEVAAILQARGIKDVLLVSDPFHSLRITSMASELGLRGRASPTRSSPISSSDEMRYFARESVAVGLGRIVGYRRVTGVSSRVRQGNTSR